MLLASSAADKLLTGTYTALLGIGIVFSMLLVLVVFVTFMTKFNDGSISALIAKIKNKTTKSKDATVETAVESQTVASAPAVVCDAKLIAAITAAITACMDQCDDASKADFVVKAIRKI